MVHGVKWLFSDTRYLRKNHLCPDCKGRLKIVKVSRIVNSRSPEAGAFDFRRPGGTYYGGNVKFIWKELKCPDCGRQISAAQMQLLEGLYIADKPGPVRDALRKSMFFLFLLAFLAVMWFLYGAR